MEKASKLDGEPLLVARRGVCARMVDVDESEENDRSQEEESEQPEKEILRMCSSRGLDPRRWPRPLKMGMMAMGAWCVGVGMYERVSVSVSGCKSLWGIDE